MLLAMKLLAQLQQRLAGTAVNIVGAVVSGVGSVVILKLVEFPELPVAFVARIIYVYVVSALTVLSVYSTSALAVSATNVVYAAVPILLNIRYPVMVSSFGLSHIKFTSSCVCVPPNPVGVSGTVNISANTVTVSTISLEFPAASVTVYVTRYSPAVLVSTSSPVMVLTVVEASTISVTSLKVYVPSYATVVAKSAVFPSTSKVGAVVSAVVIVTSLESPELPVSLIA